MKVLAVGAHLDDIELACGGTLAKAIDKGHQVKMIVMSESGYTNYDGRIMRTAHDAICEGRNAAHVLGVGDIEILKFDSKDIPYHYDVIEILDEKIQNYSPDIIFTHWILTHTSHMREWQSQQLQRLVDIIMSICMNRFIQLGVLMLHLDLKCT